MSISTIESATAFGVLDADAIADGSSFSALVARSIGRQANRLLKKRHTLLSLVWRTGTETINDVAQYRAEFTLDNQETTILPPMTVRKKPGITKADVYIRALIPNTREVTFRFSTLAQTDPRLQEMTVTGTGAPAWYTREIDLDPGAIEYFHLMARTGADLGALMDTAAYGTPNTDTIAFLDVLTPTEYTRKGGGTGWDHTMVAAGHSFRIIVANDIVLADQRIFGFSDLGGHHTLFFEAMDAGAYTAALSAKDQDLGLIEFEIRQLPWFALYQVLVVSKERTL